MAGLSQETAEGILCNSVILPVKPAVPCISVNCTELMQLSKEE